LKYCYIDRFDYQKEQTNLPDPFVGKAVPFNEEARLKELDGMVHNSVIFSEHFSTHSDSMVSQSL
jgi:hypothetical protein